MKCHVWSQQFSPEVGCHTPVTQPSPGLEKPRQDACRACPLGRWSAVVAANSTSSCHACPAGRRRTANDGCRVKDRSFQKHQTDGSYMVIYIGNSETSQYILWWYQVIQTNWSSKNKSLETRYNSESFQLKLFLIDFDSVYWGFVNPQLWSWWSN